MAYSQRVRDEQQTQIEILKQQLLKEAQFVKQDSDSRVNMLSE
jgi:hypothetical protein